MNPNAIGPAGLGMEIGRDLILAPIQHPAYRCVELNLFHSELNDDIRISNQRALFPANSELGRLPSCARLSYLDRLVDFRF